MTKRKSLLAGLLVGAASCVAVACIGNSPATTYPESDGLTGDVVDSGPSQIDGAPDSGGCASALFCDSFDLPKSSPFEPTWTGKSVSGGELVRDDVTAVSAPNALLVSLPSLDAGADAASLEAQLFKSLPTAARAARLDFDVYVDNLDAANVSEGTRPRWIASIASLQFVAADQSRYLVALNLQDPDAAGPAGHVLGIGERFTKASGETLPASLPTRLWSHVSLTVDLVSNSPSSTVEVDGKVVGVRSLQEVPALAYARIELYLGMYTTPGLLGAPGLRVRYDNVSIRGLSLDP